MADEQTERDDGGGVATANETLSVTDNRTGENYEVPIEDGTVKAMDFRQIKVSEDDFGLMTYDPAFTNTASCTARSWTFAASPCPRVRSCCPGKPCARKTKHPAITIS